MKNQLYLLMAIGVVFSSCKKGDEDPSLSFLSRKARLTGDWEIFEYTRSAGEIQTSANKVNNGNFLVEYSVSANDTLTTEMKLGEFSIHISKDGTWNFIIDLEQNVEMKNGIGKTTGNFQSYRIISGVWSFGTKIKDEYKNKERLILDILYDSSFQDSHLLFHDEHDPFGIDYFTDHPEQINVNKYELGNEVFIIDLQMLKNDKMKWVGNEDKFFQKRFDGLQLSTNYSDSYSYVWMKK